MVTVLNFVEVLVMDFTSEEKLYSINKIEFFEEWLKHEKDKRCDRLFEFISTKFNFSDITEECEREIKMKLASISSKIATRWVSSGKSKERFLNKNKLWLEGQEIEFCVRSTLPQPSTSTAELSRPGRPRKDFEDASFKTKKRRVEDLVQSRSVGELMTAAELPASACLNIQQTSAVQRDRPLSNDEALAYYIDSKSTTHSYKQTRKWTMKVGHHVFPSYECIVKAKKGCYPSEEHIVVTQSRAEIELQAILNKTAERLIEAQREVVTSVLPNISPNSSFTLLIKYRTTRQKCNISTIVLATGPLRSRSSSTRLRSRHRSTSARSQSRHLSPRTRSPSVECHTPSPSAIQQPSNIQNIEISQVLVDEVPETVPNETEVNGQQQETGLMEIDTDIISAMGAVEEEPVSGPSTHNEIVQRWTPILSKGLKKRRQGYIAKRICSFS
ncbi:hypothetical protein HF086_008253 [Spodoptera exigua]|uniref:Uncharacterized protein n=1 Tax=Spodoptera exigua TaxID=7107 RepID=A0A922MS82_SPOEX|nr:hypothetical protein HF086_008253 [Spodoptera exigua]